MTRKNWLRVGAYGTLGGIVLLFAAHPYTRQTAFGPRIKGMPFAYWQDRCRDAALPPVQELSFTARVLRFLNTNKGSGITATVEMLPVVLSLRDDPSEHVRAHVAKLLGRYANSEEACAALFDFLDDPSAMVRAAAVRALGAMDPPHHLALSKLRERLDDNDATCRLRAACAIFQVEKQPDTRASAVLHEALQSTDEGHRHEAMHNLCGLLERNVEFLALVRQLVASNPDVAGACASCLMDVGPVGIPLLIDLLGAHDRAARQMAAYRLGSFAGRLGAREADVITALLVLRNDADRFVREHAAIALWQIDPQHFARPGGAPAKKR